MTDSKFAFSPATMDALLASSDEDPFTTLVNDPVFSNKENKRPMDTKSPQSHSPICGSIFANKQNQRPMDTQSPRSPSPDSDQAKDSQSSDQSIFSADTHVNTYPKGVFSQYIPVITTKLKLRKRRKRCEPRPSVVQRANPAYFPKRARARSKRAPPLTPLARTH